MEANTYTTPGTTGGNREDLRDILTILEPEDTPAVSMIKKGPAPSATYIEVMADTLRAPRKTGTKEGSDAGRGGNKTIKRQRFGTNLHRVMDEFGVTDVQELISRNGGVAAVTDEYAASKAKTIRELKRDVEAVVCSDQDMQAAGDNTDMQTRGIGSWLNPNPQTTHPVPADFRPPAASVVSGYTAITEAQLNTILVSIKRQYGGKRTFQALSGDLVVQTIDNFTRVQPSSTNQRYQVRQDANEYEITMMVKIFESSAARLEIVPDQFLKVSAAGVDDQYTCYILNMDLWEMQFLDALHAQDLPDQGGGPRGFVKAIFGLLCKNPKGNGMFYNS